MTFLYVLSERTYKNSSDGGDLRAQGCPRKRAVTTETEKQFIYLYVICRMIFISSPRLLALIDPEYVAIFFSALFPEIRIIADELAMHENWRRIRKEIYETYATIRSVLEREFYWR